MSTRVTFVIPRSNPSRTPPCGVRPRLPIGRDPGPARERPLGAATGALSPYIPNRSAWEPVLTAVSVRASDSTR